MSLANISSQTAACLLLHFTLCFTEQRILISMKCSWSVIFFMVVPVVLYLKSHHHTQGQLGFLLCSFLGVFSFLFYIYVYNPSWLNFRDRYEVCVQIHLPTCGCLAAPAPFVERLFLPHCVACAPLSKISCCVYGSVSRLSILLRWPVSILLPHLSFLLSHCLDNCTFIVSLKVQWCWCSNFVLLCHTMLAVPGVSL